MVKKSGLGAGLGALFGSFDEDISSLGDSVSELNISQVITNPNQPRKAFDEQALYELSESIKNVGVIQPILVCQADDKYVIVAGERRYRACVMAGLDKVPVIIKNFSEKECKEIALIENLQREDLNPIEEATAMKALADDFDLSQEELAARLGKSRSAVANTIRLLNLNEAVMDMVRNNRLSAGHARALVPIKDASVQIKYAKAACDKKMSVRELENLVNAYLNNSKELPKRKIKISAELKSLINDMQRVFATKVKAVGNEDKGRITIDYYTKDDLQRIFDIIEEIKNN